MFGLYRAVASEIKKTFKKLRHHVVLKSYTFSKQQGFKTGPKIPDDDNNLYYSTWNRKNIDIKRFQPTYYDFLLASRV